MAAGSDRDLLHGKMFGAGEGLHERTVTVEAVERVPRSEDEQVEDEVRDRGTAFAAGRARTGA